MQAEGWFDFDLGPDGEGESDESIGDGLLDEEENEDTDQNEDMEDEELD